MRTSVKSTICRLRRIIPERHTLWDRFYENRIPHPVMKESMDNALKEGKRSFPDKLPSGLATRRISFYQNPMCYSFTPDRVRLKCHSSREDKHRIQSTIRAIEKPTDSTEIGSLLPFVQLLNWAAVTGRRLFDLKSMRYRLIPDRLECRWSLSKENHLVTKYTPMLLYMSNHHDDGASIPKVSKFTAFVWMTTKKFCQAMFPKLKRTSKMQAPILRSRYVVPM